MCGSPSPAGDPKQCRYFDSGSAAWPTFGSTNFEHAGGGYASNPSLGLVVAAGNSSGATLNNKVEAFAGAAWQLLADLPTAVVGNCLLSVDNTR